MTHSSVRWQSAQMSSSSALGLVLVQVKLNSLGMVNGLLAMMHTVKTMQGRCTLVAVRIVLWEAKVLHTLVILRELESNVSMKCGKIFIDISVTALVE